MQTVGEARSLVTPERCGPADLMVRNAQELQETLPLQQFASRRRASLAKQLRALETVSRRLQGEHFSLQEEVRRCYDLDVDWLPESTFEQAYALYDEALPGRDSIAERLHQSQASFTFPPEKTSLLPSFFQLALTAPTRHTQTLFPLPAPPQTKLHT